MKLLVINGPNLNLLGLREPAIYGSQNYESLLALIRAACDAEGIEVGFAQSNHEGAIVDAIQAAYGVYDLSLIHIYTPYIEELARQEGILLDPVYTGKAWAKFLMLVKEGYFDGQEHIAFVHTGGAAALFAMELG